MQQATGNALAPGFIILTFLVPLSLMRDRSRRFLLRHAVPAMKKRAARK
jgi:hypothetical protein